jgi:uncharacterized protein with von Willebrand factor type A (vWA) domain
MEENTTNESVEHVETTEEAPAPSLDDIASEFSVEEQVNQFKAQPQPQPQYQPQYQPQAPQSLQVPDPYSDPTGYERFMLNQANALGTLDNTLKEVTSKIQSYEQQMAQQKVSADLDKAVTKINEKLGVDPMLAEIALEREYRVNKSFKTIWDNRDRNPAAFQKALDVLGNKLAPNFANQRDPQLIENQRAAKASQRTMSTAPKEDPLGDWSNLSQSEFDRKWASLKGS